ncbi:hypothetical protein [Amaricoccus solimangrovi]|uniref:Alpha/beta hydrolase n=1 Tax=Amaricoccus solimangrovi TaxID=2589815 RepID=A0A501WD51_9RHOB|nr:hypothetical protein [Amaricoccus solimangrovi]TPE47873.1 hypothetical protein FJM51_19240 [Amaricoccus solimangrovi]
MVRIAFVHGINNEKSTPQCIAERWWAALLRGWETLGLTQVERPQIDVGFYGTILANAVAGAKSRAVHQGGNTSGGHLGQAFLETYLRDMTGETLDCVPGAASPGDAVAQGPVKQRLVHAAAAVERHLRNHGKWLAKGYLPQAVAYIDDPGLAAQIGVTVRKQIFDTHDEETILIAHSLGTVVSYKLLAGDAKLRNRRVPLFMTLGSPLGIGMMRSILPARRTVPDPPVAAWVNAYRRDDFVALNRPLTRETIGLSGVDNIADGLNEEADPHSVEAYLSSPPICARIYDKLRA